MKIKRTIYNIGVLGLCSVVSACPYDIPDHLPEVLTVLGDHLHDPNPIPATVKRVLQDFKRTHQDNWTEHKVVLIPFSKESLVISQLFETWKKNCVYNEIKSFIGFPIKFSV